MLFPRRSWSGRRRDCRTWIPRPTRRAATTTSASTTRGGCLWMAGGPTPRHPVIMDELRQACAAVAARARSVTVVGEAIPASAARLTPDPDPASQPPPTQVEREARAAYWLTMDAINFGSGWFPTLRKRGTLSGYNTIASALREHFDQGGWTAAQLTTLDAATLGPILGQDPGHDLMGLYAAALRDLGERVTAAHDGQFAAV